MSKSDNFLEYYSIEKEKLNKYIVDYNNKVVLDDNQIIKRYLCDFADLNSDGKLIRGILVNFGYSLLKEDSDYSSYLALAYEVFQTAILIHDDIIDRDDKRRGKKTIHSRNNDYYKDYTENTLELNHLSNSIGLCVGDYGLYEANRIIADNYCNDKNLGRVISYFDSICLKTIKGEILDVILPFNAKNKSETIKDLEKQIINIYYLKTALYTIIGPLVSGMVLAGSDDSKIDDITKFGEKIGVAFQIQDDILGIYSDSMGKNIGSDIKEFKQTILYSYILDSDYSKEFNEIYGREDIVMDDIIKVRELFKISGALDYAYRMMNQLYDEGLEYLDSISWMDSSKKDLLKGFVEYLRERDK